MIDDDDAAGVYYSIQLETKIIRVMDNLFIPSVIKIRADVNPEVDMHSIEMAHTTLKMKGWVDTHLNSTIAISADNMDAYKMIFDEKGEFRCANNVMMTPGVPTDDILSILLQAKFDAFAGNTDTFGMCEVRSDNVLGLRATFVGTARSCLPDIEQWIGKRSYFDEPWWNRDDISTYDITPPEGADLSIVPEWAAPMISPIDLRPPRSAPAENKGPNVILRPSFKPTVIDGGKKPDA